MSLRIFDISRRKRDRKSIASREDRQVDMAAVQAAVLEEVLCELTMMSDDELLESLLAPGSTKPTDTTDLNSEDPSGDTVDKEQLESEPSVFTEEVEGLFDDLITEANLSDAISSFADEDLDSIRNVISEFDPDQDSADLEGAVAAGASPVSGIIKDETILSFLHHDIVDMSHVFEAIRSRDGSMDLWRVLAEVEGVDAEQIYYEIAKKHGYSGYPYLDAAPTREFIEESLSYLSSETLHELLDRGLLPVDLEPEGESGRFKMIIVSHDPTSESVQDYLHSIDLNSDLKYSSQAEVADRIQQVRTWVDSTSRFGVEEGTESIELEFDPNEEDLEQVLRDAIIEVEEGDPLSERTIDVTRPEPIDPEEEERQKAEQAELAEFQDRVVRSLIAKGIVSKEQVREAAYILEAEGGREALWRVLADVSSVTKEMVYAEAANVYAFRHAEVGPGRPDHDFVMLTMETIAQDKRDDMLEMLLLPFEHLLDYETGTGRIVFVTPDPTRPEVNSLLHELDLGRFELRYVDESVIISLIDEIFPRKNEYLERIEDQTSAFDLGTTYEDASSEVVDEDALEAEISRSKLINLFEASLVEAVRMDASDLHIFPNPQRQVEIHFRLDGRLKKWHTEDNIHPEAYIAIIKDNSTNVDRFERDAAQDGFIQRTIDDALIRFRVSILPIASANQELRAESIVIRVLDDRKVLTDIRKLGMLDIALERFDKAIRQPHGMVILTGPTGSGKSTTLVAALHQVVTPEVNVLTVEDPVEYIIRGVRQIKLNNKLNLEDALRAILRHDPDVVMVGEMRDRETAELAIKLANTGHLTFSTLHTNDAPAAVSRLYKMGVEPFLIAYAINLVVAQRLIRTVCDECKVVDESPDRVLMKSLGWTDEEIDLHTTYKANLGSGCSHCGGNGFKGRRAVCETLYFSDAIRHMIAEAGEAINEEAIRNKATEEGMLTLQDSARVLVNDGHTTVQEMLRVTGA